MVRCGGIGPELGTRLPSTHCPDEDAVEPLYSRTRTTLFSNRRIYSILIGNGMIA